MKPIHLWHKASTALFSDIREQMKLIERGVNQKEMRYINRALRCIQALRKKTNDAILRRVTVAYYPSSKGEREEGERGREWEL